MFFSLIRDFSSENGKSKDRSVEDIKERFYQIQAVTSKQVQKVTITTLSKSLFPRGSKIKAQLFLKDYNRLCSARVTRKIRSFN